MTLGEILHALQVAYPGEFLDPAGDACVVLDDPLLATRCVRVTWTEDFPNQKSG